MANRTDAVDRSKANTGRRCDHEILWPPLYTVKWTREHVPIVFFTILSDPPCALQDPETGGIVQAEVRFEWPNSILVWIPWAVPTSLSPSSLWAILLLPWAAAVSKHHHHQHRPLSLCLCVSLERMPSSLFCFIVLSAYACRSEVTAGSGHEYLGNYALPLLRTNAHILRFPFEL